MFLKNRIILAAFILLIIYGFTGGDNGGNNFRKLDNKAFKVGEKLTFELNYGFVTAGVAVMEIPKIKRISGRQAFHVVFTVNSVPSFDWIYKVRDRYETYIDVEGLFPWRFEQHIREGGYTRDFSAFFDQRKGKAKTSEGEYEIPIYVNDIVSAFYFARTLDYSNMKVGDKIKMQNFYKDKVYNLDVKFLGRETIDVPSGTFDCLMVEPLVKEGGLFKHDGNIIIWLTDDELKMPVRVKTKIVIGYVDAVLKDYQGLAGPLDAKH
ncbi:hypothetical protein BMS3Abin03_00737 [bacterium BMS3Abin03]|nr:hypothetical protein BMS3Abin03_00737 [bacterium BMS3Abin03]